MTITLSPETEAKLCKQAQVSGESPNNLVEAYVKNMLAWEERELQETLEALKEAEEDFAAGRHKPASEVIARMREMLRKGI